MTRHRFGRLLAIVLTAIMVTTAIGTGLGGPVVGVAAAQSSSSTAVAGAYDDGLSGPAGELDALIGYRVPGWVQTYAGDPGWYVTYDDGKRASLVEWIDESSDRDLIVEDNASNWVLLSAPPAHVLGGLTLGLPPSRMPALASQSFVETVDVEQVHDIPAPVTDLDGEAAYRRPVHDLLVPGAWSPSGVAFAEDATTSTLQDVRETVGVDAVTANGSGIRVAVIDTGADVGDGEVYGNGTGGSAVRVVGAKNFITNETVNVSAGDPDWSIIADGNDHGSWVASAIAANTTNSSHDGIAPGADLLIGKALDDDGSGSTEDIRAAIAWAERNDADIISLSLGSPFYSPTLAAEIEEALDGNVTVVVAAAGNSRMNPATRFIASPADTPIKGVVGVAATNTRAPANASSAYFSNVGPDTGTRDLSNGATAGVMPDVGAPGMQIQAEILSSPGGTTTVVELSGTSMAAPIVTGGIALALEANPAWQGDTDRVVEELHASASPMPEAGLTEVGHGMVNASNLVDRTHPDAEQADERTADAVGRDQANHGYAGSRGLQFLAGVGRGA